MREMYSFEKMDDMHQNLRIQSKNDGVFIADSEGNIIYANDKAEFIYEMEGEVKKIIRNGSMHFVVDEKEISLYSMMDGKGKLFFGVIRDRSEFIRMMKTVAAAYEGMKAFKEDVAHYFFNPICIAKGYLQLAMDGEKDIEERNKMEKVKTAIERIEAVVRNIVMNGKITE